MPPRPHFLHQQHCNVPENSTLRKEHQTTPQVAPQFHMAFMRSVASVAVLLLSAFIYSNFVLFSTFYYNAPGRLQSVNRPGKVEVKFKDDVRNCEDILLNEHEAWMLLSCDPGRDRWNTVMGTFLNHTPPPETGLYLWKYTEIPGSSGAKPVQLKLRPFAKGQRDFHPLGIEYHAPSKTIFAVNHASTASKIRLYKLDAEKGEVTLFISIEDPRIAAPNSIAAISDTEFFVTNDHYFLARNNIALAKLETYTALPGGSVAHVKLVKGAKPEIRTLARVPFANGITILNDTTLAVASSVSAAVYLYNITHEAAGPVLTKKSSIKVPFIPDNISVDGKGKMLIAGHPHAPSLEEISKNNQFCQHADADKDDRCQLHRLSWIADWSEEEGLSSIYVGAEYGTSSTAVRDTSRGMGFASGLYEQGILSWVE